MIISKCYLNFYTANISHSGKDRNFNFKRNYSKKKYFQLNYFKANYYLLLMSAATVQYISFKHNLNNTLFYKQT